MNSTKKGSRKPNWTSDECLSLVQLVESNKSVIRGKFSSRLTSEDKKRTWGTIKDSINASHPHVVRSIDEVEKKWYNLLSKSRQDISTYRRGLTGTGGGPSTAPLSAVASTVESILGESNVSISGIDNGMDSTMLQFISISRLDSREEVLDSVDPVIVPDQVLLPDPVSAGGQVSVPLPMSMPMSMPLQVQVDRKRELKLKVLEAQLEYFNLKIKKMKNN